MKENKEYWLQFEGPCALQSALRVWCQANLEMTLEEYQDQQLNKQIEYLTSRMETSQNQSNT